MAAHCHYRYHSHSHSLSTWWNRNLVWPTWFYMLIIIHLFVVNWYHIITVVKKWFTMNENKKIKNLLWYTKAFEHVSVFINTTQRLVFSQWNYFKLRCVSFSRKRNNEWHCSKWVFASRWCSADTIFCMRTLSSSE